MTHLKVMSILQVVWTVLAVFVFAVFTGSATVGAFANARPPQNNGFGNGGGHHRAVRDTDTDTDRISAGEAAAAGTFIYNFNSPSNN